MSNLLRRNFTALFAIFAAFAIPSGLPAIWQTGLRAQSAPTIGERVAEIVSRPEFRHAMFGVEVASLDTGRVLYRLREDKLFTPASTTKLLTMGTALELLGADYRFQTRVYRVGSLSKDGTLKGDLILVASGDPDLSARIQPGGTLAFENHDHAYGGSVDTRAVPGDPLMVIRDLAAQVAAHGVKKISGRVLVDATLFPEGEREGGTGVVISPIVVNDNVVDVTLAPGAAPGAPATLSASPQSPYVTFLNKAATGPADSHPNIDFSPDDAAPDGSHTVTIAGTMPAGQPPILFAYPVPSPRRFAEMALAAALKEKGVAIAPEKNPAPPDFSALARAYTAENQLAEHVSPPLSEEIKVTLKVSQNLHASMMPYLLGAILGHAKDNPQQAGFGLEREFLTKAALDLTGAVQADGAGGARSANFTPDFMVHYLTFMSKQKNFDIFYNALPILGRDGTLWKIQTDSPAAGHVHAKTGTYASYDALNHDLLMNAKGLAGFISTPDGRHLVFAAYVNNVSLPLDDPDAADRVGGQALGEIAAAAYNAPAESPSAADFDVVIRGGHIVDGSGNPWYSADVGIRGDRIAAIGNLSEAKAKRVIDASGLVVAPGFIDMLGQSESSLLIDNRAISKLAQGITTEITGEGGSIAPQDALTLAPLKPSLDHYHLTVDWTDLAGYFARLEKSGTPINLGTYVGAAQVREAVIGDDDRAPTAEELARMKALVAQAMQQGALGVSTALIYPPGFYAKTDELIALAKVAAQYGGIYATHMRSEGASETSALDEAIRIGREAGLPVEIFHMKVSGKSRWGDMKDVVAKIEAARESGLDIRADMYPYLAGATALASALPPWVANGGPEKLLARLRDSQIRARIKKEMAAEGPDWENLYFDCGGASGVMISSVFNPDLKKYTGKFVSDVAADQHKEPLDALMDFVLADNAQTGALYFMASEQDLQLGLRQPWTSIGLDANEMPLDGPLYEPHTHPRAFGAMPRFLGHYVRDARLMPLEQAIRKITSMPAGREHLAQRGLLAPNYFADIAIFDPNTIRDTATYEKPDQLAVGVSYVFVNGTLAFENGKMTGAMPGRALRGLGYRAPETGNPPMMNRPGAN